MNILEQAKDKEFVKEQFVKGHILDDTKDYGRTQFVDEIYELQQENKQLKEDIKNIIKILDKNCDDLEATEEEFDSLDRWQGLQVVELEDKEVSE